MAAPEIHHFTRGTSAVREAFLVKDGYFTTRYAVAPSGAVHADAMTSRAGADVEALMQEDLDVAQVGECGFFHVSSLDLAPILSGEQEVPGEVRDFFTRHVPKAVFEAALVPSEVPFNRVLNYHLQGDREARLQIVRALPALRADFHKADEGSEILRLVDARQSPAIELQRRHELDDAGFKAVRRLQAIQSRAIAEGDATAWKAVQNNLIRDVPKILTPNHDVTDMNDVRTVARALRSIAMGDFGPVPLQLKLRAFRGSAISEWPRILDAIKDIPHSARDFTTMVGVIAETVITTGIARKRAPESLLVSAEVIPRIVNGEQLDQLDDNRIDTAEGFCDAIQATRSSRGEVRQACEKIIAGNFSLKRFKEFSERWHHQQASMREKAMSVPAELKWDPLVGNIPVAGLNARELRSNRDLEAQGVAQNNCVGGYTDVLIKSNRSKVELIFSLETEASVASTIRVEGRPTGRRGAYEWRVGEHSAHSNNRPSPAALRAANELIEFLHSLPAETVADYGRRMARAEGLPAKISRVMEDSRANVFDPDTPETLLAAYASVLPRQLRGWTADDWTRAAAAAGCTGAINRVEAQFVSLEEKTMKMKQEEIDHEPQP